MNKEIINESTRYYLNRYIRVLNGKIIDTTLLLPHVECYFITDNKLYVEYIDGTYTYLGQVVVETNDLSKLDGELEFKPQ